MLALLLTLTAGLATAQQPPTPLQLGQVELRVLQAGAEGEVPSAEFRFVAPEAGEYALTVGAIDFDVALEVQVGREVFRASCARAEFCAQLALPALVAGAEVRVRVGSNEGWTGRCELGIARADAPDPDVEQILARFEALARAELEAPHVRESALARCRARIVVGEQLLARGETLAARTVLEASAADLQCVPAGAAALRAPAWAGSLALLSDGRAFRPSLTERERHFLVHADDLRLATELARLEAERSSFEGCIEERLELCLRAGASGMAAQLTLAAVSADDTPQLAPVVRRWLRRVVEDPRSGPEPTARVELVQALGRGYAAAGEVELELALYRDAGPELLALEASEAQAVRLFEIAARHNAAGRRHEARGWLEHGRRVLQRCDEPHPFLEANACILAAELLEAAGRLEPALDELVRGSEWCAAIDGARRAAATALELGLSRGQVLRELGRLQEAHDVLARLGAAARERGDTLSVARAGIAQGSCLASTPGDPRLEPLLEANRRAIAALADPEQQREWGARQRVLEAQVRSLQGAFAPAKELALGAANALRDLHDPENELNALETAVRASLALRDLGEAELLYARGQRLLEQRTRDGSAAERAATQQMFASWGALAQEFVATRIQAAGQDAQRVERLVREGHQEAQGWKGRLQLVDLGQRAAAGADPAAAPVLEATVDADRVRETLRTDGRRRLFVEYVSGSANLYAYVIDPRGLRCHDLGPRAELEGLARAFVQAIQEVAEPASVRALAQLGHQLYLRLLERVLRDARPAFDAAGFDRLVVVPTTGLASLPFEALLQREITPELLKRNFAHWPWVVRDFQVDYAPSTPLLRHLTLLPRRVVPGGTFLFGPPDYSRSPSPGARNTPDPSRLANLVGGFEEALAVARAHRAAGPDELRSLIERLEGPACEPPYRLESAGLDAYLLSDATAENFARLDARHQRVYVISHAEVDAQDPRRSSLLLTPRGSAYERVTLEQISALRLEADLVVLSCCSTAAGPTRAGEGVRSFANAFLQAGARAVIATLWDIDDDKTREIFAGRARVDDPRLGWIRPNFHQQVAQGEESPARALWRAKSGLLQSVARGKGAGGELSQTQRKSDPADPYYWAAFVYSGALR